MVDVFAAFAYFEILRPVVLLVAVDVMDHFVRFEYPADFLLSYDDVLEYAIACGSAWMPRHV